MRRGWRPLPGAGPFWASVGTLGEQFQSNAEMARVHWDVTERIRVVRRLDFTRADHIDATCAEHAKIRAR